MAQSCDIAQMLKIERQSASAAHWAEQQYEALFSSAPSAERLPLVAEQDEKESAHGPSIAGFLVARRVDSEWELENIVVEKAARRHGVGRLLLEALLSEIKRTYGDGLFLEVRESNLAARALYRGVGFAETGLRNGYYSNPPENAVLCKLIIS